MKPCPGCATENHDQAAECKQCRRPFPEHTPQPATPPSRWAAAPVTVTDINMPFGSMVWFMVKWAVATIPALIILFVAGAICVAVLGGIGLGLRGLSSVASRPSRTSLPSSGDQITLDVTNADGNVAVTNATDYMLNVCRAEREGRRAFLPTMPGSGATVTVRPSDFRPSDGAYDGSELRIICNVDGVDTLAAIR